MTEHSRRKAGRPKGTGTNGRTRTLTIPELTKFFTAAEAASPRVDLMLVLAFHFALRAGEVAKIHFQHFVEKDYGDGRGIQTVLIVQGLKGGSTIEALVPPEIVKKLDAWLEARGDRPNPWLFPHQRMIRHPSDHMTPEGVKTAFRIVLAKSGIVGHYSVHDLRHSKAQLMALDNKTLPEIAGWLRHKSVSSSDRYIHAVAMQRQAVSQSKFLSKVLSGVSHA